MLSVCLQLCTLAGLKRTWRFWKHKHAFAAVSVEENNNSTQLNCCGEDFDSYEKFRAAFAKGNWWWIAALQEEEETSRRSHTSKAALSSQNHGGNCIFFKRLRTKKSNNCWGHAFPRRSINNALQHQKDSIECFLIKPISFSFHEAQVMTSHLRIHLPNQSTFQSSPQSWEHDPLFPSVRCPSNLSRSLTSQEPMVKAPSLPFSAFCKI